MIEWCQEFLQKQNQKQGVKTPGYVVTILILFSILHGAAARADAPANHKQIAELVKHYEQQLVAAINQQNFEKVAPYLLQGSPLYKAQQRVVASLANKGITEEYVHHYLGNLISQSSRPEFKIEVHERLRIRTPGKIVKEADYHWIYTVAPKDGRLYLSAIEKADISRYITHDSTKAEFFYADDLLQAYCNALIALLNGKTWPAWMAESISPEAQEQHKKLLAALHVYAKPNRVFGLTRDGMVEQDEDFEQMQGYRTKRMAISYREPAQPAVSLDLRFTVTLKEYREIHDGMTGGGALITGISDVLLR